MEAANIQIGVFSRGECPLTCTFQRGTFFKRHNSGPPLRGALVCVAALLIGEAVTMCKEGITQLRGVKLTTNAWSFASHGDPLQPIGLCALLMDEKVGDLFVLCLPELLF
mmetsp:Transcript_37370/g.74669  ORF Transcript_37370/g.74669 Transcript_37370/m.74669 type:complete len:110 (-) Transcript_37370:2332-2661(-)